MTDEQKEPGLLFRGKLANGEVVTVEVPIRAGALGASIHWPDATSSAAILLEMTSGRAALGDLQAKSWKDTGVSITGPAASAAGCSLVNVENSRQKRARFRITAAAVTNIEVWDGTAP